MKKIEIYSPKGGVQEIELPSNSTVNDLYQKIKRVTGMSSIRMIDGNTFNEYSVMSAKLPDDIEVVHVTVKDSKAGSYKELKSKLTKEDKEILNKRIREKRKNKRLNWTNVSYEELEKYFREKDKKRSSKKRKNSKKSSVKKQKRRNFREEHMKIIENLI